MEKDRLSNVGRVPKPGELYKHFKNKLYQIITVATHSETGEQMVVYQALYGDFKMYVRPLVMFVSEVDHEKYPDVKQRFRFELYDIEEESENTLPDKGTSIDMGLVNTAGAETNNKAEEKTEIKIEAEIAEVTVERTEGRGKEMTERRAEERMEGRDNGRAEKRTEDDSVDMVDPQLLRFLDADSYEEKLNIFIGLKKGMNDRLLTNISTSLDIPLEEGTIEEQYEIIKFKLQTFTRFESNRFR